MLKIFRKIRQKLLTENNTWKYFKYAIGEIVLVVIGILIALQINNWNDQYRIAQEEEVLLLDIIKDIDQDIETLKFTIERDSIFIVSNKIVLSAFKNDSLLKDTSTFARTAVNSSFFQSFNPTNTVFNSMQSTGKLSYVLSDLIRKEIQTYYDYSAYIVEGDQLNTDVIVGLNAKSRPYVDLNSLSQAVLPEFGRYELDELDLSFFSKPINSSEVKDFANDLTAKQMLMYPIYIGHKKLLLRAEKLKQDLTNYLKENK